MTKTLQINFSKIQKIEYFELEELDEFTYTVKTKDL